MLAIIGDQDPLKRGVDALDGVVPNLKVVVITGGDHVSTFRDQCFRDRLNEFLQAHSTAPAATAAGRKADSQ